MKKWIKKSFVALVTILTFGMISPYQIINAADEVDKTDKDEVLERSQSTDIETIEYDLSSPKESLREQFLSHAYQEAEFQALLKFGQRIAPVIENEFQELILPNIEKAISDCIAQFGDRDLTSLVISEKPGKGQSEKIFHIFNEETGEDVIRFHVRRDLRPLEGYWFNFHYHTFHDSFQTHYELGDIFWDKNTPPNWMN